MQFDWYQFTVRDEHLGTYPHMVIELLAEELDVETVDYGRGLNGYESTAILRDAPGSVVGRVSFGGRNRWPNVLASGGSAVAMAEVSRRRWPAHLVTRCDVASDFRGPSAFDDACKVLLAEAESRRLRVSMAGDWREGSDAGRTLYVGSRQALAHVRVYEKGLEQRGKAATPAAAEAIPVDWVRAELEVKPQKEGPRRLVAGLSAEDMWGLSPWTRAVAQELLELDVDRVSASTWTPADDVRAMQWALRHYGAVFEREAKRLGGWDRLGSKLGAAWEASK